MTHTPGLWEAFTEDKFSGWWAIRQIETGLEVGSGDGGDKKEDAMLKAAAPELLEALQKANFRLQFANKHVDCTEEIDLCNAAIAKATKGAE